MRRTGAGRLCQGAFNSPSEPIEEAVAPAVQWRASAEFTLKARASHFQSAVVNDLVNALSMAVDLESRPRISHGHRVGLVGALLAFELEPSRAAAVYMGGLLHDVAAVGLSYHSLPLSALRLHPRRREIIGHTDRGAEIVAQIPGIPEGTDDAVRDHHEWWQGLGYPRGKNGAEISLEGQILRLADGTDELIRLLEPRTAKDLLLSLGQTVGAEFSPEVYRVFRQIIRKPGVVRELDDRWSVSLLLRRVTQRLPRLKVPAGVDAMGTAATIFGRVIDSKHAYTQGHSERVARYAMILANWMGVSHGDITQLRFASLLHDAGKLAVPVFILDKPGPLSEQEWDVVRIHPVLTQEILGAMRGLRNLADIAASHHERFDGNGYPRGLRGERIPMLARIMSVADAFDAMTSARPYQPDRDVQRAAAVLRDSAGTQFWPDAVEAAVQVLPDAALSVRQKTGEKQ